MCTRSLEKIKIEHLADVLDIYNHYVLNSTATFHTETLAAEEMRQLVFFANPRYQTYVMLAGSECCGYAYIGQHKGRHGAQKGGFHLHLLTPCCLSPIGDLAPVGPASLLE